VVRHVDVDPGLAAEEGSCHLCDKLLFAVVLGAERIQARDPVAVQARLVPGRMRELVEERAVVVLRGVEALGQRHLHVVARRVVGRIAAVS
jgi:hypothetical protein